MQIDQLIQYITLAVIPILFAITLHEAAHGYVARHFGDATAERAGRISLNPIHHIDPVGTILFPIVTLIASQGSIIFGWAKPVPVNFGALNNPKKDMLWVALAGPASNLFMAFCWAAIAKISLAMQSSYFAAPSLAMALYGVKINTILIALNMLPIPPLDGGRVAVSLLPHRQAIALSKLEPYGMFILIFMVLPIFNGASLLGLVLFPVINMLDGLVYSIFGL
jgi:Zn-dependent protease